MKKIVKNFIYFFFAILIAKFLGTFKSFFLAKILGPANYGIWATLLIVTAYYPITSLGVGETLLKKIPYYLGKNDLFSIKKLENSILGFIFIISIVTLVMGILGITIVYFLPVDVNNELLFFIFLMLIYLTIRSFTGYFDMRFNAYQNFKTLSSLESLRSFLIFAIQISLAYFFGLSGAVIGFLISEIIISILTIVKNNSMHGKIKLEFDFKIIRDAIRIGLPITIVVWMFMVQTTTDRIVSISLLGKTATGYYSIGVAIISIFILIPKAVSKVLYPKLNLKYGKNENKHDLIPITVKPTLALSISFPYIIAVIIAILPFAYKVLIPKYGPGLLSAQILLLGAFFQALNKTGIHFLISTNNNRTLLVNMIICIFLNVIGNLTFVQLGFYIEGIALSTTLSGIYLTTVIWFSIFRSIGNNISQSIYLILQFYLPVIFLLIIGITIKLIYPAFLTRTDIFILVDIILMIVPLTICIFSVRAYRTVLKEIISILTKKKKKKIEVVP